ncbi:RagB/SusD family nutrient uptake outer membrane protein [Formosa sp. PL04]|uniref:RagB/SusD family nutrient uptake outer membrane protein n=1 Tax=Formosa sp. PL04 TaxID=3081755 RepID=UPI00298209D6|nr:RagB/SusD family nutrient uptake outer membrane protein [Formosa sp. PL04]MDW5290971.1 RagB/SusD family nutrient uptake outer membrane protein [Formosa sp. PL04]
MKKFTFSIFTMAVLLFSCENELVQTPNTNKVADGFYTNEAEIEEAINATYATLQFSGNYDIGMPSIGEIPGEDSYDETPANDGGNYGQLDLYNVISQNSIIANVWNHSYIGIQRANIVLNRINEIEYSNEDTKKSRIGEMYFLRALFYFNLVRVYGDVPIVLDEVNNPQDYFGQTRMAEAEVYNQIKEDLLEAIQLLPVRNETNKMRVVKTAGQALLGKVELTLGNYSQAQSNLQSVVNSGIHDLVAVNDVFAADNELNGEIIFAVQFSSGINGNSEGTDAYRMFNPTGRVEGNMTGTKGHGVLKPDFYKLYEDNDSRKGAYIGVLESGIAYNKKIAIPTTVVDDAENDWIVLRYADVILMLAEIENELGNSTQAIQYLNQIYNRASIGEYSGMATKDSIFQAIDLQRRLELVWEGHRWFDLKRQGRAQEILGISDSNKLLMPLPASQIATDNALKQNPGY